MTHAPVLLLLLHLMPSTAQPVPVSHWKTKSELVGIRTAQTLAEVLVQGLFTRDLDAGSVSSGPRWGSQQKSDSEKFFGTQDPLYSINCKEKKQRVRIQSRRGDGEWDVITT